MSIRVNRVDVPIVWSPSDLRGGDSDGHVGRGSQIIRALVFHRIVGTLETTVNQTFYPTTDDLMTKGERRVSSHFGLGHWGNTGLRVVQFVALENTAYCNGQHDSDRAACTWSTWIRAGRPDPNEMTVSFEHEDNAAAGNYIVTEDIIELSIALAGLLLSGDGKAIRAAGIRCSDAAAAQLGRITPSTETLVPHRTVAPVTKPYCWTKYGGDAGFPQLRYVRELSAPAPAPKPEEDMAIAVALDATKGPAPDLTAFALAKVKGAGHDLYPVGHNGPPLFNVPDGRDLGLVQKGTIVGDVPAWAVGRERCVQTNIDGKPYLALEVDVALSPAPNVAADAVRAALAHVAAPAQEVLTAIQEATPR